jgi:integrase
VRKTYKGITYTVVFDHKPTQKEVTQAMAAEMDKEPVKKTRLTFETAAQQYIESKSNILSPATEREYLNTIKRLSDHFRELLVSDITQNDIQIEINRFAKTLSPKTVRNYHGFISAILGVYRPNLKLSTTLPQKRKSKPYIPSDRDVKIIMEQSAGTMFEIPIALGCYGLRRSEICALDINTDLDGNTLHIDKAMVMDKNKKWVIKYTKTTESTRDVIISSNLAEKIRKQGYVYRGHPNSISDYMGRLEARYNITHFSLHKLRHYFASKMSALKIPEADIMAMGGWETDYVMKMIYRHAMEENKKDSQQIAAEKLNEVMFS